MSVGDRPKAKWGRLARFLVVGGINTLFGYCAFATFLWLGLAKELAVLFGNLAGIAFNFHSVGHVLTRRGYARLPHFVGVYGVLYLLNIPLLRGLVAAGLGPYLAQGILVLLLVPISYFAMRRLVFQPAPELVA
jgi:putative flippase GtrA